MSTYEIVEADVRKHVWRGAFDEAISCCESALRQIDRTDFHAAIGHDWLHQVTACSTWLSDQYQHISKLLAPKEVQALYCEMNRFEINNDRWWIAILAYNSIFPREKRVSLNWLCTYSYIAPMRDGFTLTGAKPLQRIFNTHFEEDEPSDEILPAAELAILLLTVRMQQMVHLATLDALSRKMLPKNILLLSAAHDSDIYCVSNSQHL